MQSPFSLVIYNLIKCKLSSTLNVYVNVNIRRLLNKENTCNPLKVL